MILERRKRRGRSARGRLEGLPFLRAQAGATPRAERVPAYLLRDAVSARPRARGTEQRRRLFLPGALSNEVEERRRASVGHWV